MNFFARQEDARRSSRRLVILFVLAVVAVVVAIDLVVYFAGWGVKVHGSQPGEPVTTAVDWIRIAWVSGAALAVVFVASLYRTLSLRSGGGAAVARGLGATPVPSDTQNFAWKRLRNVIEEIAIASSVPVPEIFVMENEAGINAFAAGYSPADAAVCVTQGCLDKLTRDEMQGVIAHEFSHVLNGDMRINIRLIGLLFGILVIGIMGRLLMFSGGRVSTGRSRGNGNSTVYIALIGIALLIIGYIGFFFGRLIQAAVARSRETLADASAVQFTRQSSGIAGALKKIAALSEGSELEAGKKQEVAHMLFGEGGHGMSWFATHPPLMQRIKALDPAFDPAELEQITRAWQQPRQASPHPGDSEDDVTSLSGLAPLIVAGAMAAGAGSRGRAAAAGMPAADATTAVDAGRVTEQVAQPQTADFRAAASLRDGMPDALRAAAHDPHQACAMVLALALARDDQATARAQIEQLQAHPELADPGRVHALAQAIAQMHPLLRLPLASLVFPNLRHLPRPRLNAFIELLQSLVTADEHVSLDEYCLAKLVQVQVLDALDPGATASARGVRLRHCVDEVRDLFAVVARFGNEDADRARQAFQGGINETFPRRNLTYAQPAQWQTALDQALAKLDCLRPAGKELVIRGLTRAIADDGMVNVAEAELLRTVCAALHCPLPPLLQPAGVA